MAKTPAAKPKAPAAPKPAAAPVQAAPEADAPVAAPAGPEAASEPLQAVLSAHGAHLAEVKRTDAGDLQVKLHAPHSIERFVAAARAHPQVRDVQVLPSHIELHVAGDALAADAAD